MVLALLDDLHRARLLSDFVYNSSDHSFERSTQEIVTMSKVKVDIIFANN